MNNSNAIEATGERHRAATQSIVANGHLLSALAARDQVDLPAALGTTPAELDAILAGRVAPSVAIIARTVLAFPRTPVARMFRVTA